MMGRRKKREKEILRRRRKRQWVRLAEVRQANCSDADGATFPQFRVVDTLASPTFSGLVSKVIEETDFADTRFLPEGTREFFRMVCSRGRNAAYAYLRNELGHLAKTESDAIRLSALPQRILGDAIVKRILEKDPEVFPMNDIEVHVRGHSIVLALSSMLQRPTSGGTVFHSVARLTVQYEGMDFVVAFSRHAIDQICERFKPDFKTYNGLGDAHAVFSYLAYAELTHLNRGQPAIAIYDICLGPGFWEYDNYVGRCMPNAPRRGVDEWIETHRPYGYRVGYCPVVFNGGYAIAKTFLPPGYSDTPERQLIHEKATSQAERERLISLAGDVNYHTLRSGDAMDAIEWFHKNGIPQVIDPPVPLFNHDYFKRKVGTN